MLAIYTRLSREDEKSNSIKNQIREGKEFAKLNKFKSIEIYNEGEGVSGGADIEHRPQLFRLLQDIREGIIKAVWFRHQDRLERSSSTYIIFIGECKKYSCKIYFGNSQFDFNDPNVNLLGQITSAVNEYQKNLQKVKTKRTLKDNVKEGKVWSVLAYGYKSENGYLAINEKEAEVVREIYNLSLSGKGYGYIAELLNSRKVKTRKNKLWRDKTINGIIKNTIYKGERFYSGNYYDAPIIIESNLWEKVNANLENNRNNSGKKVDHKYLLKGIIKCSKCGRNYYGKRRVDKSDNYYQCSSTRYKELKCGNRGINIDVLEGFIWNRFFADKRILEITKRHLNNDDLKVKLSLLRQENDKLNKELISLEKERKKAVEMLLKELINEDDFKVNKERIDRVKSDLIIKIKNNNEQISFYESSELKTEEINKDLELLNSATYNDKRDLIKKYVHQIEVLYKEPYYLLRIEFKLSDYFSQDNKFKTDYSGNTLAKTEVNNLPLNNLVENYIIDRNYNIAIDVCYNFIYPISKKVKGLNKIEKSEYAEFLESDFNKTYKPSLDINENRLLFNK